MPIDACAFLPLKVSFVSLQSEEFHIYTQYCTNYPRYTLAISSSASRHLHPESGRGVQHQCWWQVVCTRHGTECHGEITWHADYGWRGTQVGIHSAEGLPAEPVGRMLCKRIKRSGGILQGKTKRTGCVQFEFLSVPPLVAWHALKNLRGT